MNEELNQEQPTSVSTESGVAMEPSEAAAPSPHKTHTLSLALLSLLAVAVVGAYWYSNTVGVEPAVEEVVVQEVEDDTSGGDEEYNAMMEIMTASSEANTTEEVEPSEMESIMMQLEARSGQDDEPDAGLSAEEETSVEPDATSEPAQ